MKQTQPVTSILNQHLINLLMGTVLSACSQPFKHLTRNGTMHNALTAHGASTHPAWDCMGYPIIGKCDVIPTYPNQQWFDAFPDLDAMCDLALQLQRQAV